MFIEIEVVAGAPLVPSTPAKPCSPCGPIGPVAPSSPSQAERAAIKVVANIVVVNLFMFFFLYKNASKLSA
jgi:hypothetical protein